MISRVHSSILQGIDAIGCEVEADMSHGGQGEIKPKRSGGAVGAGGPGRDGRQGVRFSHPGSPSQQRLSLARAGILEPGDVVEVRGQESAKRAITVAAAGHHNPPLAE